MKWTKAHIGSLFMLPALIFLYCLPDTAETGSMQVTAPKITSVCKSKSRNQLKWSCCVDPGLLRDETLVYWLVNDSFVETAFPSGRVEMSINESIEYIQSDLIFQSVQDFEDNTFTCVALSPAGMDRWILTGPKQSRRWLCNNKKRRHLVNAAEM